MSINVSSRYVEEVVRPAFEEYMREKYAEYDRPMMPTGDYLHEVVLKSVDNPVGGEVKSYTNMMTHYMWVGFRDAHVRLHYV